MAGQGASYLTVARKVSPQVKRYTAWQTLSQLNGSSLSFLFCLSHQLHPSGTQNCSTGQLSETQPKPPLLHTACHKFTFSCRKLTQLECLELCNGHLKDEGIRHLEPLAALTSLSLAQNSCISDASLLTISKLVNLRTLNLAGCLKVSGNGIQTLQTLTVCLSLPRSSPTCSPTP